jgi:hypothetical protein
LWVFKNFLNITKMERVENMAINQIVEFTDTANRLKDCGDAIFRGGNLILVEEI